MSGQGWVVWLLLGLVMAVALILWYMIGWRNRMLRPKEPEQIELADGRVMDAVQARIIGSFHWGESKRVQYNPDDYEEPLHCLSCQRPILPKQHFWETPLINSGGLSFQTCLSCQPGDVQGVAGG